MKLFLRALSLLVLSLVALFANDAKAAATTVSGAINFDQTWTTAGSLKSNLLNHFNLNNLLDAGINSIDLKTLLLQD